MEAVSNVKARQAEAPSAPVTPPVSTQRAGERSKVIPFVKPLPPPAVKATPPQGVKGGYAAGQLASAIPSSRLAAGWDVEAPTIVSGAPSVAAAVGSAPARAVAPEPLPPPPPALPQPQPVVEALRRAEKAVVVQPQVAPPVAKPVATAPLSVVTAPAQDRPRAPSAPAPVAVAPATMPFARPMSAPTVEPSRAPSFPTYQAAANDAAADVALPSRWAIFEKLGLGPKTDVSQKTAKFLVSTYRLLGFAVLTIIVVVLVGYIATSSFYFVSDSWIQPMVVSPSDEKVVELKAQVAEQENVRDRIVADLAHADRYIVSQQGFQAEFAKAIRADLNGRKAALGRVRELARDYAGARGKIKRSNQAFANASRRRMAKEYAAGLIDRSDMLSGKYQLAQITSSNLSLAERQVEYETRAAALEAEAKALNGVLSDNGGEAALSYDVLRIKQEYEMSRLETAKAIENRKTLKASLGRQDQILAGLKQSPYLRAVENQAQVSFVPYENLDNVKPGEPLYRCRLEMLFCRKVGAVVEILPGEVKFKHPQREKILRGRMIEVKLDDREAAEQDVLFVGGRPLLI